MSETWMQKATKALNFFHQNSNFRLKFAPKLTGTLLYFEH